MFKHVVLSRLKDSANGKSRAEHAQYNEGYVTHHAHEAIVDAIKGIRTERRLIDWET